MNLILRSIGINYELSEYTTIIQNILHTLKHDCDFDDSTSDTDDNDETQFENSFNNFQISEDTQIDQMLLQHQRHITMKHNVPNRLDGNQLIIENEEFEQEFHLNTAENSFFDIINCNVQENHDVDRLFIMRKMEEPRGMHL